MYKFHVSFLHKKCHRTIIHISIICANLKLHFKFAQIQEGCFLCRRTICHWCASKRRTKVPGKETESNGTGSNGRILAGFARRRPKRIHGRKLRTCGRENWNGTALVARRTEPDIDMRSGTKANRTLPPDRDAPADRKRICPHTNISRWLGICRTVKFKVQADRQCSACQLGVCSGQVSNKTVQRYWKSYTFIINNK